MAGVYLISIASQKAEGAENPLLGNLILLGTGVVWTAYIFSTRRVVRQSPRRPRCPSTRPLAGFIGFLPFTAV